MMMILRNLPAPLLRTLLKMLTRCVKTTLLYLKQGLNARHIYQKYVTYQYCPIYSLSEHHGGS